LCHLEVFHNKMQSNIDVKPFINAFACVCDWVRYFMSTKSVSASCPVTVRVRVRGRVRARFGLGLGLADLRNGGPQSPPCCVLR